jgi:hypothetical protein
MFIVYPIGRLNPKMLPDPISLLTQICPPSASINSFEIARPRPVPLAFDPGTQYLRRFIGNKSFTLFENRNYLFELR